MCNVFPASAVCRPRQVLAWDFDLLPNDEILPIEFSRCLKLADAAAGTPGHLLLNGVCSNGSSTPDFPFTRDNLVACARRHFRHRHVRHAGAYLWFRGGSLQNHRSTGPRRSINFPSQTTRLGSSATDNRTADLIRQSFVVGEIFVL